MSGFSSSMPLQNVLAVMLFITYITASEIASRSMIRGAQYDSSCNIYASQLREAVFGVKNLAKAGWKEAKRADNPSFAKFFLPSHQQLVQLVMKNIYDTMQGTGVVVTVTCKQDDFCTQHTTPLGYVDDHKSLPAEQSIVHLCPQAFTANPPYATVPNVCSPNINHEVTLATLLLHELTHVQSITNSSYVDDHMMLYGQCELLRELTASQGDEIHFSPATNAQSYVFMAWESLEFAAMHNPRMCPQESPDHNDLRRLQGLNFTLQDTSVIDLSASDESNGSTNDTASDDTEMDSSVTTETPASNISNTVYAFRDLYVPLPVDINVTTQGIDVPVNTKIVNDTAANLTFVEYGP